MITKPQRPLSKEYMRDFLLGEDGRWEFDSGPDLVCVDSDMNVSYRMNSDYCAAPIRSCNTVERLYILVIDGLKKYLEELDVIELIALENDVKLATLLYFAN